MYTAIVTKASPVYVMSSLILILCLRRSFRRGSLRFRRWLGGLLCRRLSIRRALLGDRGRRRSGGCLQGYSCALGSRLRLFARLLAVGQYFRDAQKREFL